METSNGPATNEPPISPYSRLQSPNIRLVSFQASDDDSRIMVDLLEVPLTKDLEYHALSYVWSHGLDPKTIWVNNRSFVVSQHLYNYLDMARRHDVISGLPHPTEQGDNDEAHLKALDSEQPKPNEVVDRCDLY